MDLGRMNNPTEQVDFRRLLFSMAGIVASKFLCLSCLDMIIMIRFCELKILCVISYNYNRLILV